MFSWPNMILANFRFIKFNSEFGQFLKALNIITNRLRPAISSKNFSLEVKATRELNLEAPPTI